MRKIELLVPASSLEVLKIAVIFGADAVYIGGEAFGLRAKAKNFSHEDMKEGIAFAHEHGVKVYVTVNILAHNYDLPGVREYLTELKELKPDALIIADPGIYMYAKEICPEIERHISTQANNTNYGTYQFWHQLGARRVVTARELSMAELKENGFITLKSVSDDVKLAEEDLLITMTQMEGYVTEGDNTVTVVLDTNLTPELIEEGFVREIISKIQTMRKEAGFEVMDKIMISYQADDKVAAIFDKYGDAIKADVLGLDVVAGSVDGYEKEWNINGETVLLGVKKVE
mgnify:CR=1 FL=1